MASKQIILRDGNLRVMRDRRSIRVARDAHTGNGAYRAPVTMGWLSSVFSLLGDTRRYAVCLTPDAKLTVLGTGVVNTVHQNRAALLEAAINVTQGSAVKAVALALMPAAGADLTAQALTPASTRSFGVRIQLGDSLNGFKAGGYTISLLDGATTLYQVLVEAPCRCNNVELVLLSVTSAGGLASLVPLVSPLVTITGSASGSATVTQQTSVSIQSLNQRDIGDITSGGKF